MFNLRCERCAIKLYSASARLQCPDCGARLELEEWQLVARPLAQPRFRTERETAAAPRVRSA